MEVGDSFPYGAICTTTGLFFTAVEIISRHYPKLELNKHNYYSAYTKLNPYDVAYKDCYVEEYYKDSYDEHDYDDYRYKFKRVDFYFTQPYEAGNKHAYAEHNKAKSNKFPGGHKDIELYLKQYLKKVEKPAPPAPPSGGNPNPGRPG